MSDLFLNDLFWTIQGEGAHAGRAALFVRMPYCNLRCSWCDTKFDSHTKWSEKDFLDFASQSRGNLAVVTGGEPMMHRHTPKVVEHLKMLGFEVAVETNGTFAPNAPFDWITCSPKRDAEYEVNEVLYPRVNEFKYVVDDSFDWSVLSKHESDPSSRRHSLSPEFSHFEERTKEILTYIAAHPRWRLNLQTHKWIGVA